MFIAFIAFYIFRVYGVSFTMYCICLCVQSTADWPGRRGHLLLAIIPASWTLTTALAQLATYCWLGPAGHLLLAGPSWPLYACLTQLATYCWLGPTGHLVLAWPSWPLTAGWTQLATYCWLGPAGHLLLAIPAGHFLLAWPSWPPINEDQWRQPTADLGRGNHGITKLSEQTQFIWNTLYLFFAPAQRRGSSTSWPVWRHKMSW